MSRSPRTIRPMQADDASTVAELAGQLGYPASRDEIRERFSALAVNDRGVVLVAVDEIAGSPAPGPVVGWAHVERRVTLVAPASAQLMALVVADGARNRGVGRDLLHAAEQWAAMRGCRSLMVATRVTRENAHRFYRREGYALDKTSHVFTRSLETAR